MIEQNNRADRSIKGILENSEIEKTVTELCAEGISLEVVGLEALSLEKITILNHCEIFEKTVLCTDTNIAVPVWGIYAVFSDGTSARHDDISTCYDDVFLIKERLLGLDISILHLPDIIEDFINELFSVVLLSEKVSA